MQLKQLPLAVLIILLLSTRNNQEQQKSANNEQTGLLPEPDQDLRESYGKQEIVKQINSFFKNYKGDFRSVNHRLISADLAQLIEKAISREKLEAGKLATSDSPTDKPLLIEGDIFTSLYEGQDHFKIESIKLNKKIATVTITFTNSKFNESWKDEMILIKSESWRIDNVIFKGKAVELQSTKAVLLHFIDQKD